MYQLVATSMFTVLRVHGMNHNYGFVQFDMDEPMLANPRPASKMQGAQVCYTVSAGQSDLSDIGTSSCEPCGMQSVSGQPWSCVIGLGGIPPGPCPHKGWWDLWLARARPPACGWGNG